MNEASELKVDLVDACENIRVGTGLFAKVYRIVTKWYGSEPLEAFDDAVYAWQTGYFEGRSVFLEPEPGEPETGAANIKSENHDGAPSTLATPAKDVTSHGDHPACADPRVDLSRINGSQ